MSFEVYQALSTYALEKKDIDLQLTLGLPPRRLQLDAEFTAPIAKVYTDRSDMMALHKTSAGVAWSGAFVNTPSQQTIVEVWPFKNNSLGLVIETRKGAVASSWGPFDYHTGLPLAEDDFLMSSS